MELLELTINFLGGVPSQRGFLFKILGTIQASLTSGAYFQDLIVIKNLLKYHSVNKNILDILLNIIYGHL